MKTNRSGCFCALAGATLLLTVAVGTADVPGPQPGGFGGIYKVVSSNDPLFPATQTREYFLDFGRGVQADQSSGSVAVSVRVNPNVQVRILAWQYLPAQGRILIGNPYAKGSRKAVALGAWKMTGLANGVLFERGNHQVVLRRADPNDY